MEQQRFEDGENWARKADYSFPEVRYNIKVEPMLRQLANGWVTRNRYDAECLNSPILFAADIDFRTDDDTIASRDIVREVFYSYGMTSKITIEPLRMVETRLREVIADPVGNEMREHAAYRARKGTIEDIAREMAIDCQRGDPAVALLLLERLGYFNRLGFRLYESRNGFRVICSSTVFGLRTDAEKAVAGHLQKRLFCDHAYRYICAEQGLFRLRLTPKPWRTCDGTGRAARYIGTYGSEEIEPRLAELIAEHDRVACVDPSGGSETWLA